MVVTGKNSAGAKLAGAKEGVWMEEEEEEEEGGLDGGREGGGGGGGA